MAHVRSKMTCLAAAALIAGLVSGCSGGLPSLPKVGDLRITFTKVPDSDVSIVAKQVGSSFAPYRAKAGPTVDLQTKGIVSLDEMFTGAEDANIAAMWALRISGFILTAIDSNLTRFLTDQKSRAAGVVGGYGVFGAMSTGQIPLLPPMPPTASATPPPPSSPTRLPPPPGS